MIYYCLGKNQFEYAVWIIKAIINQFRQYPANVKPGMYSVLERSFLSLFDETQTLKINGLAVDLISFFLMHESFRNKVHKYIFALHINYSFILCSGCGHYRKND
jgi:hypothetical protein